MEAVRKMPFEKFAWYWRRHSGSRAGVAEAFRHLPWDLQGGAGQPPASIVAQEERETVSCRIARQHLVPACGIRILEFQVEQTRHSQNALPRGRHEKRFEFLTELQPQEDRQHNYEKRKIQQRQKEELRCQREPR